MTIQTIFVALLSATTVLGRMLPAVVARDGMAEVTRNTRKLADLPQVDFSRKTHTGSVPSLNFTHHQSTGTGTALDKRTVINSNVRLSPIECLTPASGSAPDSDDCTRVCNAIIGYTSPVIVGPLEINEWSVGLCTLGILNLQACDTLQIDPLSMFGSACEAMVNQCIGYGEDGWLTGANPPFAVSLYGEAAAPPYEQQPC